HFGLLDEYDGGYGQLQGTFYQDLIQPQRFALQRLPEALVSGRQDFLGGHVYADYDAEADYMYRSNGQSGMRLALKPKLAVPWRLGDYLYGFGSVGVQGTAYDVSGNLVDIIPVGTKMPSPVGTLQYNNDLTSGPLGHGGLQANAIPTLETGIGTIVDRVYD